MLYGDCSVRRCSLLTRISVNSWAALLFRDYSVRRCSLLARAGRAAPTTGEVQCGSRDGPVPAGESESADAGRGGGVGRVLATAAVARRPPRERFGLGRTRPAALYLWYCGCTARISGWWGFHARSCVRLDDRGLAAVSLARPGAPGAGRIAPCAEAQAS